MSRRADPVRIYQAHRAGTLRRLVLEGELPERAEDLVAAWERQTAEDGQERDGRYWEAGWAWIAGRRAAWSTQARLSHGDRL